MTNDKIKIKKIPHIGGWTGPFIMALPHTRVVRSSAALSKKIGKYYGENFVYSEGAYYSNKAAARKVSIMTLVLGLMIFSPLRKFLRPFLESLVRVHHKRLWILGFLKAGF